MGTVSKALSLLSHFTKGRPEIGLSDLARLSDLNKATAYRLLSELADKGFVEQTGTGRAYRLGPVFPRLATLREAAVPTRNVARGVLEKLSDATGETAHMSLLHGDVLRVETYTYSPLHGTRVTMNESETIAFHATSSGLAVLGYCEPDYREARLNGPLEQFTPSSITDKDALRVKIDEVRVTGIAESISGYEADVHSHASPIFNSREACIGAVAVAAPVARMTPELRSRVRETVKQSALELTRLLGGLAPDSFKDLVEGPGDNARLVQSHTPLRASAPS